MCCVDVWRLYKNDEYYIKGRYEGNSLTLIRSNRVVCEWRGGVGGVWSAMPALNILICFLFLSRVTLMC